jgi:hypothetical protein
MNLDDKLVTLFKMLTCTNNNTDNLKKRVSNVENDIVNLSDANVQLNRRVKTLEYKSIDALSEMVTDDNSSSDNEADNVDEYSQSMRDYESRQKDKHFVSTASLCVTPTRDSVPFTNEDTAVNLTVNSNS